jgi:ribosome biogenesis GTPase / thiamine phosphate phosphatase
MVETMKNKLIELGIPENIIKEAENYPDLTLGRVISQYNNYYKIATNDNELLAEVSGKFRYETTSVSNFPVVGDYVLLDRENDKNGYAIIHTLLDRFSLLSRKIAGNEHDIQGIAANIDKIFICMSLNNDYNLRRLERYLTISWESGAKPIIVLTKSDLCEDINNKLSEIEQIALGVDVVVTSNKNLNDYFPLLKYIKSGITIAFVGSSGVGKSTLINQLMGSELIDTNEISKTEKGKHTTTRKDLYLIPSGGIVIDTPGMREIGIEGSDISQTFIDIEELTKQCKFNNCKHENEPNCAVRKAIDESIISEERFINYQKLKKESEYEGLNSKQIDKKKTKEMYSEFGGIKNAKKFLKSKRN